MMTEAEVLQLYRPAGLYRHHIRMLVIEGKRNGDARRRLARTYLDQVKAMLSLDPKGPPHYAGMEPPAGQES